MPIYTEMIKDKKTGKMIPKLVDGQKQHFIRTYVTDENGNRKQVTRHNKEWLGRDGYNLAHQEEVRLKSKKIMNISFNHVACDYFVEYKKTGKISTYNSYYKAYCTHIKPYFNNKNIELIDTSDIRSWHEYMLNKKQLSSNGKTIKNNSLSTNYLNKINAVLSNIFDFAISNYNLEYNPTKMYGNFKEKKGIIKTIQKNYITYEEFEKFISVIDEDLWYTYFVFLFYAGTRKGEAMCLHWSNVDFKNKKIILKNTLQVDIKGGFIETTNKTNTERTIIMNDRLYDVLYAYYTKQSKQNGYNADWYVFGGERPISKTTADRKKSQYFKFAKVKEITNHQFRHSLTTVLIQEYVKQQQKNNTKIDKYAFLQALATRNGHTVETMLKYYAHLFPETEQQQVIDLLNILGK